MGSDSGSSDETDEERASPPEPLSEISNSMPSESLFSIDDYLKMYRVAASEVAFQILRSLDEHGKLSTSELAEITGREDNDLHYYLRTLKRHALIQNRRNPNTGTSETYSYYVLTELAQTILEHGLADGVELLAEQETEIAEKFSTEG